jgi:hypothetical protein
LRGVKPVERESNYPHRMLILGLPAVAAPAATSGCLAENNLVP